MLRFDIMQFRRMIVATQFGSIYGNTLVFQSVVMMMHAAAKYRMNGKSN
jgi:hypothetical protein